jgi:pimeloyl-ACP methyl ester carboxylesterase
MLLRIILSNIHTSTMTHNSDSLNHPDGNIFYVGGHYIQDALGTHMTGQMFVRRCGKKVSGQPAVIFIHGAAQTGTHWEVTADGRPGLALLQATADWECYVVDQPGVGRSRYHATDIGDLTHYKVEELESAFTAQQPESSAWAHLHTQWPGSGKRGDPIFDTWYASQVGHIGSYIKVETLFRPAIKALLERVGPAYLVTHSQSGPLGWHAADVCPELVRGIVALEPHGPPFTYPGRAPFNSRPEIIGKVVHPYGITSTPLTYDPPLPADAEILSFARLPKTLVAADSRQPRENAIPLGPRQVSPARRLKNLSQVSIMLVTAEASYHSVYDHLTVEVLREAGVTAEHVYLADRGIHGNGHMMAIEKNNKQIQQFITDWLKKQITANKSVLNGNGEAFGPES